MGLEAKIDTVVGVLTIIKTVPSLFEEVYTF